MSKTVKVTTIQDFDTKRWTYEAGGAVFPDSFRLRASASAVAKLVRADRGAVAALGLCAALAHASGYWKGVR